MEEFQEVDAGVKWGPYQKPGVKKSSEKRGAAKLYRCIGWDTETLFGRVFYSGLSEGERYETCYGPQKDHIRFFLDFIKPKNHLDAEVIWCFNLVFDLGVLLFDRARKFCPETSGKKAPTRMKWFDPQYNVEFDLALSKPCFGKIKFSEGGYCVQLRDVAAYFPERTTLEKALIMSGAPYAKQKKPAKIGTHLYSERFLKKYLESDVKGVEFLGRMVTDWHTRFNVPLSVSAPMLASQIFRKHCLEVDLKPSPRWSHAAALASYHGGKLFQEPGTYPGARLVDIRSAYPDAMKRLPKFCCGAWKTFVYEQKEPQKTLPPGFSAHGIYAVTGELFSCRWGIFYPPKSNKPSKPGPLLSQWVTGYELQEALKWDHCTWTRLVSLQWVPKDCEHGNAFQKFIDLFYVLKRDSKDLSEVLMSKLLMISLYGKFGQRNPDEFGNKTVPGPLFEPMIYTLITSHTRVVIHHWEHVLKSKHTATDSIITTEEIPKQVLSKELGFLDVQVEGTATIIRNKCYAFHNLQGEVLKYALHGYQGELAMLMSKAGQGSFEYTRRGLLNWRTAWKKGLQPGQPVVKKMRFNLLQGGSRGN